MIGRVFITQSNICDEAFLRRKALSQTFEWVLNTPLISFVYLDNFFINDKIRIKLQLYGNNRLDSKINKKYIKCT